MKNFQDDQFKRLNNAVSLSSDSKEKMKQVILNTPVKQKKYIFPKVLSTVLTLFVIGLSYTLISSNFTEQTNPAGNLSEGEIIDLQTPKTLPHIQVEEDMFTIEWLSDSMDRGNHDLQTDVHGNLVISENLHPSNRGDIIYYQVNEQEQIGRVIGLPGEKVEISNGQVYIDDKILKTFYGSATSGGLTKEEYFERVETDNINIEGKEEYFNTFMDPVLVEKDTVFVLVDMWWRGTDSREYGLISLNQVEGKVIGYEEKKEQSTDDSTLFELSQDEEIAYTNFKKDFQLEHLRGLEPISIAKLYIIAGIEKEYEVEYALYTDREDYIQWTLEEHLNIPESHKGTKEQLIETYKDIDKGTFIQTSDYRGYISFDSEIGKMGFQMVQNEDGIWQVGFLPIQ